MSREDPTLNRKEAIAQKAKNLDEILKVPNKIDRRDFIIKNLREKKDLLQENYRNVTNEFFLILTELTEQIPNYQGDRLCELDYFIFLNQFEENLQVPVGNNLLKRIFFIPSLNEAKDILVNLVDRVIPDDKIFRDGENGLDIEAYIIVFKSGIAKSGNAWSHFLLKYQRKKIEETLEIPKFHDLLKEIKREADKEILGEKQGDDKIYYFIFFDDMIGTGNQFYESFIIEIWFNFGNLIKEIINSGKRLKFLLLSVIGSKFSRKYISDEINNHYPNINIFPPNQIEYYYEISQSSKAFNKDIWDDISLLEKLKDFLKEKHPKWWEGYKPKDMDIRASQSLVVLDWNTPNNTIGCLWKSTKNWNALFPRVEKSKKKEDESEFPKLDELIANL